MADNRSRSRRYGLPALLLAALLLTTTACRSSGGNASTPQDPLTHASASSSVSAEDICGTPPCVRFLSRGETKTLAGTLSDHPIASAVALHAAVTVLCGGILCLLGEGVTFAYVDRVAKSAADQHACIKVSILPEKDKWRLVDLSPSNEGRYCTD